MNSKIKEIATLGKIMKYQRDKVRIIATKVLADVCTTTVEFEEEPLSFVAPLGLYNHPDKGELIFELHKEISRKNADRVATFQTFNHQRDLPKPGSSLFYQSWLLPKAIEAILDTDTVWKRKKYPDNGDHNHCLFTSETLAAYADHQEGYYSDEYGWATIDAYIKYIEQDIYHLRDAC